MWSIVSLPMVRAQTTGWYDAAWSYRRPVTISNPCEKEITGYQVLVTLDTSYDFARAEPDGLDLQVTASDGTTPIPFWIEHWDPVGQSAAIWVKVPTVPLDGTVIYLYYGNPNSPGPRLVESPPIGPWEKSPDNPIVPIDDPGGGDSLLAENMNYDEETGHYWLVFANYRNGSIGLVWSDDPGDPTAWHWHGAIVSGANSPHLIEQDGTWYLFYADRSHGGPPYPIALATSDIVSGTYTYAGPVLTSTEPWEAYRVDEPYVFQRSDGKWIMMYMGDAGDTTEIVGYAQADDIEGPYVKFPDNPVIDFGVSGSIDAGTVADPWVVEFQGVSYIGYTVSPTKHHPWRTSYVTTTNWITFTKSNEIILDLGMPGTWDEDNAFRGAVTRFGDVYYFPYTGSTASPYVYRMGLATQPAFLPEPFNDADEVFEFYDGFDGDALDPGKWSISYTGEGGTVTVSDVLTITAQAGDQSGYVQMWGQPFIVTGTLLEAYVRHPDAGLNAGQNPSYPDETNTAGEVGYKAGLTNWDNVIRMMDYPDLTKYTIQATSGGDTSGYVTTTVDFDADWHTFRIYRTEAVTVEFQIDANPSQSLGSPYVPTFGIRPWLMSYARVPAPQSRFEVDWIRVRKYCGVEPEVEVGLEEWFDVRIVKAPDVQKVPKGSDVTFAISVTNTGTVDLWAVEVIDAVAPDCDRAFATLPAGDSVSYACSLADVTVDFTNTVQVTGTVSAGVYVSDTAVALVDVLPTIEVTKTAEPTELIDPGGLVTFTVQARNASAEQITLTVLIDSIHGDLKDQGTCSMPQNLGPEGTYACTFTATVTGAVGYIEVDEVTLTAGDDEGNQVQVTDRATVTIKAVPSVFITPTNLIVREPEGSGTFLLTLTSQPTATVSIPLSATTGECTVWPMTATLDVGNWYTGVTATVTAVDDDIDDGPQACPIETGPTMSADVDYQGLDPEDVAVIIENEDKAGIVVSPTELIVSEPDGSENFVITLTSQPTETVSIDLSPSNGECDVAPRIVTLEAGNWRDGVMVLVTAVDDDVWDGSQICIVRAGPASSSASQYHDMEVDDITVTVQDDETRWRAYLPLVVRGWPPVPGVPALHPISNPEGLGTYLVTWDTATRAETYILEEAKVSSFDVSWQIYAGPATNHLVSGQGAARYYYRVKARNSWGDGRWSKVEQVDVLWEAEPNDNGLTQANGPIIPGLTYYGTFEDAADLQDYFYLDLPASHSVELYLSNIASGENYDLVLRDTNCETVVGYSAQPGNANEHILTPPLPVGRYYIQVYNYSQVGSEQPYYLRVIYD